MSRQWPRRILDKRPGEIRRAHLRALLRAELRSEAGLSSRTRDAVFRQAAGRARRRRGPLLPIAMMSVAAAAAVVLWTIARDDAAVQPGEPPQARIHRVTGAPPTVTTSNGPAAPRTKGRIALPAAVRLGQTSTLALALPRGAELSIEPSSSVVVDADGASIEHGSVMHGVTRGRGQYGVSLGQWRVVVTGTRFWTARQPGGASVCVVEGSVEVHRAGRVVRRLGAGDGWRSSPSAPRFGEGLPCASPADETTRTRDDRADFLGEAPRDARAAKGPVRARQPRSEPAAELDAPDPDRVEACAEAPDVDACYRLLADGRGIGAETALYRLAKRVAVDEALVLWREHQRRFPDGVLAPEVELEILQVLLSRRSPEAIDAANRFLSRHSSDGHAAEVHAIRGTLRQARGDHAGAIVDYHAALAGRLGAERRQEAMFGLAAALDAAGRHAEATEAYRAYERAFPEGRFGDRAAERVRALHRGTE